MSFLEDIFHPWLHGGPRSLNLSMQGLLERLAQGPVIGDGGFVFALEKRGYVKV